MNARNANPAAAPPAAARHLVRGAASPSMVAVAVPRATIQGQHSTRRSTPERLRVLRWSGILLSVVLGLAGWGYFGYLAGVVQTISKDTVPSIVAAEKLRFELADAHTALTNVFLTSEQGDDGPYWRSFTGAVRQAQDSLLEAAQNITYGEAERGPIFSVMSGLDAYERQVGAARARGAFGADVEGADRMMQVQVWPSAIALDKANYDVLDRSYENFKRDAPLYGVGTGLVAALMLAHLLIAQRYLQVSTRRHLNPGLMAATAVLVAAALLYASCVSAGTEALRSAKEDAFDSVHALWKAKATAYEANADESLYLLEAGNAGEQQRRTDSFMQRARQIESRAAPGGPAALPGGYLGDELANITFAGEKTLAIDAAAAWERYTLIDSRLRELERSGQHAAALKLCLGTADGESDWAFEAFDKALDAVLALNQGEFDRRAARARALIHRLPLVCLAAVVLMCAGIIFGFKARLDEYRF